MILELDKMDESKGHGGRRVPAGANAVGPYTLMTKKVTIDGLVVGALEAAFVDMVRSRSVFDDRGPFVVYFRMNKSKKRRSYGVFRAAAQR